mmetsp:Transcript_23603/g.54968  ORF Transcript_23603/g.54968 Transcript_23603/m.54968 type:complete len:518 (-) Transcript_23603:399-1952(-)
MARWLKPSSLRLAALHPRGHLEASVQLQLVIQVASTSCGRVKCFKFPGRIFNSFRHLRLPPSVLSSLGFSSQLSSVKANLLGADHAPRLVCFQDTGPANKGSSFSIELGNVDLDLFAGLEDIRGGPFIGRVLRNIPFPHLNLDAFNHDIHCDITDTLNLCFRNVTFLDLVLQAHDESIPEAELHWSLVVTLPRSHQCHHHLLSNQRAVASPGTHLARQHNTFQAVSHLDNGGTTGSQLQDRHHLLVRDLCTILSLTTAREDHCNLFFALPLLHFNERHDWHLGLLLGDELGATVGGDHSSLHLVTNLEDVRGGAQGDHGHEVERHKGPLLGTNVDEATGAGEVHHRTSHLIADLRQFPRFTFLLLVLLDKVLVAEACATLSVVVHVRVDLVLPIVLLGVAGKPVRVGNISHLRILHRQGLQVLHVLEECLVAHDHVLLAHGCGSSAGTGVRKNFTPPGWPIVVHLVLELTRLFWVCALDRVKLGLPDGILGLLSSLIAFLRRNHLLEDGVLDWLLGG